MKKLLLILISLFVSFEVKSESDDLSRKKLLCDDGKIWRGYEFLKNGQYRGMVLDRTIGNLVNHIGFYTTNSSKIILSKSGSIFIDRYNLFLNFTGHFEESSHPCKLITENLELLLNKKSERILEEKKRKRKI